MATKKTYAEQLKDPRWQKKRLEILSRDGFNCQMCHDSESTLHVHHKHYHKGHMAWEYEDHELVTLCENCHESIDEEEGYAKDVLSRLAVDGPWSKGAAIAMVAGWAHSMCGHDLSEYFQQSPHNFTLGEIACWLDGVPFDYLTDLRDALNCPRPERIERIRAFVEQYKKA